jgi:hypothetical protein
LPSLNKTFNVIGYNVHILDERRNKGYAIVYIDEHISIQIFPPTDYIAPCLEWQGGTVCSLTEAEAVATAFDVATGLVRQFNDEAHAGPGNGNKNGERLAD